MATKDNHRVKFFLFAMVSGALLLASCSQSAKIFMHNSGSDTVVLTPVGPHLDKIVYQIKPDQTARIEVNLNRVANFEFARGGTTLCFSIPKFPPKYVKTTFSGGAVFAVVNEDAEVYLHGRDSDLNTYYKEPAPVQPEGFPVVAASC